MASNRPFDQVSSDAQIALTQFTEQLALALTQHNAEQWARDLGAVLVSKAMRARLPIPVSAAGYKEFEGDLRYRSLFEKSVEIVPKSWQDGIAEKAQIIEAPDFIGFADEPARMAQAAMSLPNEIIAALLEAGDSTACEFDGEFFFDVDHPVNLFDSAAGTFSNDRTGTGTNLSSGNLSLAKEYFRKRKAPNGKPAGLRMTHLLVPPALEETALNLIERDLIVESATIGAVDNRHKGTVQVVVMDELTSDSVWYSLSANKAGMRPWGLHMQSPMPEIMVLGKDSAMYESTRKVGVDGVWHVGGALLLPHCIERWAGTPP